VWRNLSIALSLIRFSRVPQVLRAVIADYFERRSIKIVPALEIDNYAMAISLVASTRGVALFPASMLERSPGGICTHWKAPPSHGARH